MGSILENKILSKGSSGIKKLHTGQSLVWNLMMKNKAIAESQIQWRVNSGISSFWWDDWLGDGPLAPQYDHITSLNNTTISHFSN